MSKSDKQLLNLYALIGSDKLKVDIILKKLNKRLEEFGDMSFNSTSFDGEINTGSEIVQACYQMPFGSEKRLVIVKNADKLKKEDNDSLISYIDKISEFCILVLVYSKLAKNTKIYKMIAQYNSTSIIDCNPPKKYELTQSLSAIARSHGGSINLNAAQKLIDLIGEDSFHLDMEIQKILLANNKGNITIEDVVKFVSKTSEYKPWDFTNAFASKDINACLKMFKESNSGAEYLLLPQTCKIIKELICVKDLGKSANQYNIAQYLGYESWRTKNHVRWANNFSKKELIQILSKALDCEIIMKSSSRSDIAFETFIIESLRK